MSIIAQEFTAGKPSPTVEKVLRQQTTDENRQYLELLDPRAAAKLDQKALLRQADAGRGVTGNATGDGTDHTGAEGKPDDAGAPDGPGQERMLSARQAARIQAALLSIALEEEIDEGLLEVETQDEGVLVRVREQGSFPSGSADLAHAFMPVLDKIAAALISEHSRLVVSGHSDAAARLSRRAPHVIARARLGLARSGAGAGAGGCDTARRPRLPGSIFAPETQIGDRVPEPLAPALEAGRRPLAGIRCVAPRPSQVVPPPVGLHHLQHLLGVGRPVGCQVQQPARLHTAREQGDERGLDQPALVVALLGPGIGEEDQYAIQGRAREPVAQQHHGVAAQHAQVVQARTLSQRQKAPDACLMHLHAQEIPLRVGRGHGRESIAHTEPDLQVTRRTAREQRIQVERAVALDTESRPQLPERAGLRPGHPSGAAHEAAHRARVPGNELASGHCPKPLLPA